MQMPLAFVHILWYAITYALGGRGCRRRRRREYGEHCRAASPATTRSSRRDSIPLLFPEQYL